MTSKEQLEQGLEFLARIIARQVLLDHQLKKKENAESPKKGIRFTFVTPQKKKQIKPNIKKTDRAHDYILEEVNPGIFTLTIPGKKKHAKPKIKKIYRNPIILAEELSARISSGECRSEADLARQMGRSRVYVNHFMHLLTLDQSILEAIKRLGDPLPKLCVTERMLRPYVRQNSDKQREIEERVLKRKSH